MMLPKIPAEKVTLGLLVTLIIALPLYVIRWKYAGIVPTTLLELLIWITAGWWTWSKLTHPFCLTFEINKKMLAGTAFLMFGAIISVMLSPHLIAASGIFRAYFFEPFLIFIILSDTLASLGTTPVGLNKWQLSPIEWVWFALYVCVGWVSVLGISQVLLGWPIITEHQADRAHAIFNNGNALALLIGPMLVYAILALVKQRTMKTVFWGTAMLLGITMLFTKSEGGVIAVLATLLITGLAQFWSKSTLYFSLAVVVGFLAFMPFISNFTYKTDNPWVREGGTLQIRLCVWEGTRDLIAENWLFGATLAGFQSLYSSNYITCDAEPLVYPHNWLLNAWTEIGLIGLIGFILIVLTVATVPANPTAPYFVYFIIHGLVDVPYFKNDLSVIFWIFVALWVWYEQKRLIEQGKV